MGEVPDFDEIARNHKMPDPDEATRGLKLSTPSTAAPQEPDAKAVDSPEEISRRGIEDAQRAEAEADGEDTRTLYEQQQDEYSEVEEETEGDHGGQKGGSSGSSGSSAAMAAASGPEPRPQRDDPDEGGETEDEQQGSAEAEPAEPAAEPVPEPEPAAEPRAAVPEPPAPAAISEPLDNTAGTDPQEVVVGPGNGLRVEGPTSKITRFPDVLISALRARIAPVAGSDFAEKVSSTCLITAFVSVKLGVDLGEVDPNTAAAMRAVAQTEPQLDSITETLTQLVAEVSSQEKGIRLLGEKVRENSRSLYSTELMSSYWFTDRMKGLKTDGATTIGDGMEKNRDRVLRTRDEFRGSVEKFRSQENDASGRRAQ